jgi:hypothetical protein
LARGYLACRCHADEQFATGSKQLFGDEYSKRRSDRAADYANLSNLAEIEGEKLGMVASPAYMRSAPSGTLKMPHGIAVRIEHANCWDGPGQ